MHTVYWLIIELLLMLTLVAMVLLNRMLMRQLKESRGWLNELADESVGRWNTLYGRLREERQKAQEHADRIKSLERTIAVLIQRHAERVGQR